MGAGQPAALSGLPAALFLKEGQYHLGLEHFADEIRPAGRDKRRSYRSEAQRFATALERQVCQEPLQWFNFYDFWRERG